MPSLGRATTSPVMAGVSPMGSGTRWLLGPPDTAIGALVTQSWMWGGELSAVQDNYTRVRIDLYWPGVRSVTINRVDADGTTSPVRNAEPLPLCTQAVVYDHEAPLDQTCYYTASTGDSPVLVSEPVAVSSGGQSWLKHPLKPALNRAVHLHVMGDRQLPARRGVARPLDRTDPIVIHQARLADAGSLVIQTDGTWAENTAIRALLADGDTLLVQQTGILGEGNLYVSVDTASLALLDAQAGWMLQRNFTLPFDVVARPTGAAAGPAGVTYADVATAYMTYEHLAAGEATYLDLAARPGP